jgi:type I restriction enzyme M protein
VVLVKSGEKDAEKRFLGYEFSNRRGSEGIHPMQRGKNIEDCTQMFDPEVFDNPTKASTYIYKAFAGDYDFDIDEAMQNNVSRHNLVDMLTFDRVDFEKNISLSVKKKVKIESKWEVFKLNQLVSIVRGASPRPIREFNTTDVNGVNWIKIGDVKPDSKYITETKEKVTLEGANKSRFVKKGDFILSNSMSFGRPYIMNIEGCIHDGWLLLSDFSKNLNKDYLYYMLSDKIVQEQFKTAASGGTSVDNLNIDKVAYTQIPLPPLDIQQKIVSEIEVLEAKEKKAKEEVEKLKVGIYSTLNKYPKGSISEICKISDKKENPQNNLEKEYVYLGLEHIESNTGKVFINKELGLNILSTKNKFDEGDVLYGKLRPYLNKVAEPNFSGICSTDILVLKTSVPKILKYLLLSEDLVNQTSVLMKGVSLPRIGVNDFLNQKIPLPSLSEQQKIVSEIEKIEAKINTLETEIAAIPKEKEAVLKKYL